MRPRALFVSYSAALGGAERLLLDWTGPLTGAVVLACPEGPLAAAARARGLAVEPLRGRRLELRAGLRDRIAAPARLLAQAVEVRRLVHALRPECVVAWNVRALLSVAAALASFRRRPRLLFQHNDLQPSGSAGVLVRRAAARADAIVAPSHAIASDLDPGRHLGMRVIHPGVDLDRFAVSPIPPGPPEVVVLGAIVGWKRPDIALRAFELARRELPELRLRLIGAALDDAGIRLRGELERSIRGAELAGSASLDGSSDDVPGALARATCLLHCAPREPFGLALAEALACGRPVVAPRSAGPAEIVDATCGALYEPGDPAAAAAALVDVVRRAPELVAPARARVEAHFDGRVAAARFAGVLAELTR